MPIIALIAVALTSSAAPATASRPIGTLFPGSVILGAPEKRHCGIRYRFSVDADGKRVAAFYLAEGAAAHLALIGDTAGKFPDFRLIALKGPAGFMNVVMNPATRPVTGTVFFERTPHPECR